MAGAVRTEYAMKENVEIAANESSVMVPVGPTEVGFAKEGIEKEVTKIATNLSNGKVPIEPETVASIEAFPAERNTSVLECSLDECVVPLGTGERIVVAEDNEKVMTSATVGEPVEKGVCSQSQDGAGCAASGVRALPNILTPTVYEDFGMTPKTYVVGTNKLAPDSELKEKIQVDSKLETLNLGKKTMTTSSEDAEIALTERLVAVVTDKTVSRNGNEEEKEVLRKTGPTA
ncbi:hypothetical protein PHYPSEUDO_006772, partial [Phytophthora pseudosyringae]